MEKEPNLYVSREDEDESEVDQGMMSPEELKEAKKAADVKSRQEVFARMLKYAKETKDELLEKNVLSLIREDSSPSQNDSESPNFFEKQKRSSGSILQEFFWRETSNNQHPLPYETIDLDIQDVAEYDATLRESFLYNAKKQEDQKLFENTILLILNDAMFYEDKQMFSKALAIYQVISRFLDYLLPSTPDVAKAIHQKVDELGKKALVEKIQNNEIALNNKIPKFIPTELNFPRSEQIDADIKDRVPEFNLSLVHIWQGEAGAPKESEGITWHHNISSPNLRREVIDLDLLSRIETSGNWEHMFYTCPFFKTGGGSYFNSFFNRKVEKKQPVAFFFLGGVNNEQYKQ